jgi:hypothetical protein
MAAFDRPVILFADGRIGGRWWWWRARARGVGVLPPPVWKVGRVGGRVGMTNPGI